MPSPLDTIARIVQRALATHAPLVAAEIPVLLEQPSKRDDGGDPAQQIENDVQTALAVMGAYMRVRQVTISDNKADGMLLYPTGQLVIECIEDTALNNTGWSQSALATEALRRLQGFALPNHIGGTLTEGRILTEEVASGVNHVAVFSFNFTLATVDRCNPVRISINAGTGAISLSCATSGASLYYLTETEEALGDYPDAGNGTLYTEPFYFFDGGVIYAAAWKDGLAPSDVASARVAMIEITALNPVITDRTADGATVNWDNVGDNEVSLQVRPVGASDWTEPVVNTQLIGETTYALTALPWHQAGYEVRVKIASTDYEAVTFVTVPDFAPIIAPDPITIPTADSRTATNETPGKESTELQWYLYDGSNTQIDTHGPAIDWLLTGLDAGNYTLKARVENAAGNGPWSNEIMVTQQ